MKAGNAIERLQTFIERHPSAGYSDLIPAIRSGIEALEKRQNKPPLLSDEEFKAEFQKLEERYKEVSMPWFWGKQVAQAQREVDIKFYAVSE